MKHSFLFRKIFVYTMLYVITGAVIASIFLLGHEERNDYPMLRLFIIAFASILLVKYFIYMIVSPWYNVIMDARLRNIKKSTQPPYHPKVSIIIPAWNEEVGLLATVKSVLQSTYRHLEVIVVNDGSTDKSDALMRDFLAYYASVVSSQTEKINIIYDYKTNEGKGAALNRAIRLSSGELIVSIDADCALRPDTIENFVKYFADPSVMAAVGNVKIGNTESILGTLQYLEFLFSFYFKKADSLFNTIYIIGGAAGAFRRTAFEQIGLYNQHNITEDIDLSVRIQDAGMRIVYAADAVVYTEGATTFEGLLKQRLRWKRGRFQTFAEHSHLFFSSAPKHNKLLTWGVLPFAIFGDVQLFFEVVFLAFLYWYSLVTHDFSSFISGIIVVSSMFFVQIVDDKSARKSLALYILAPIGWLLFYITTVVEYHALIKSLSGILSGEKMVWQRWQRRGCLAPDVKLPL